MIFLTLGDRIFIMELARGSFQDENSVPSCKKYHSLAHASKNLYVPNSFLDITLDEEKNGYVARDQLLYTLKLSAGLLPEVPYKASAPGHVGT